MSDSNLNSVYTDFIYHIISQVTPLLPDDVNDLQKEYMLNNMKKSAITFTEGMLEVEEFAQLSLEQQTFFVQAFMEWSFHKDVDLFRSGIPAKYWKVVMQKIWYTMFDVICACIKNGVTDELALPLLERYVNRTYNDSIEELKEESLISQDIETQAKEQSNIDKMANEVANKNKTKERNKDILLKVFWSLVIIAMVSRIIYYFGTIGMICILSGLLIYNLILMGKK